MCLFIFALDVSHDNFPAANVCGNAEGHANPTDEVEESKQFFELVQKFMAEYTASAKVRTIYLIFKNGNAIVSVAYFRNL